MPRECDRPICDLVDCKQQAGALHGRDEEDLDVGDPTHELDHKDMAESNPELDDAGQGRDTTASTLDAYEELLR